MPIRLAVPATWMGLWLVAAQPAGAADLDFRAAWGGIATQSAFTEIRIGIRAPEPGQYTLDLLGGETRTRVRVDAPRAQRVEVSVPYPVPGPGPVAWILRKDGAAVSTGQAPVFTRVGRRPWDIDLAETAHSPRTANVLSAVLPTLTQAYDSIRSIALTPRDLRNLTPDQSRAFEAYVLRCGRVVLLDSTPTMLTRLRQLAGCGGRHVHGARDGFRPTELPETRDIRALLGCSDCGGAQYRLTALLGIYAGLLGLAGLMGQLRLFAGLGIVASLILIVTSRTNDTYVTRLSWSQADAIAPSQVRRSVLVVDGRGRSELAVALPRTSVPELPLPSGTVLEYIASGTGPITATLKLPNEYLSRNVLSFLETGPMGRRLQGSPTPPAIALADRVAQKTGLTLALTAGTEAITHPSEGIHVQWHATVTPDGGPTE